MSIDPTSMVALLPPTRPTRADPKEAAQAFEGYLTEMMVREMRRTVPEGMLGSQAIEVFTGVLDQEISRRIAERGSLGLARSLEARIGGSPPAPPEASFELPVRGRITSRFGNRMDPIDGSDRHHDGVDIAAPIGTPITAVHGGQVVEAGVRGGYGNVVVIDQGNGTTALYAHCDRLEVAAGDRVQRGQSIATVGETGRSTGPHLHYEVRRHGRPADPMGGGR